MEFGVEVVCRFEPSGEVLPAETPAGRVASALHTGPYENLGQTHSAIQAWADANSMNFACKSWEIYGDWNEDPAKLETRIEYLLA